MPNFANWSRVFFDTDTHVTTPFLLVSSIFDQTKTINKNNSAKNCGMSNQVKDLIRIFLSDGKGHQAKEIIKHIDGKIEVSRRTIEYELTSMVESEEIHRYKNEGMSYPLYHLVIDDISKTSSHRLYTVGTKETIFFDQDKITDIIRRNFDRYKTEEKKDPTLNSSLITNTILNFLWLYQKLVFAELSYWYGNSKSELAKSKKNRIKIEEHIHEMFTDASEYNEKTWHSIIHAVHDIIDEQRILTKSQIKKLWNA